MAKIKEIRLTTKQTPKFEDADPAGCRFRKQIAERAERLAEDGASVAVVSHDDRLVDYHMGADEMREVA